MADTQAKTVSAVINATASGDTEVVAAVANKRIVVHNYVVVVSAAASVKFRSGTTDLSGPMPFAANGGVAAAGSVDNRYFATALGEALNVNLSAAVNCGGHVSYSLEPR